MPSKPKDQDPLESAIEAALEPGEFVSFRRASRMISEAQEVADEIAALISTEPERAARLLETFVGACHLKAEEFDDSGGDLGMFVEDLFRSWASARVAAGADPNETARAVIDWMADDPHGFCQDLGRVAAECLDEANLRALLTKSRAASDDIKAKQDPRDPECSYFGLKLHDTLKHTLAALGDVDGFLGLCDPFGPTAADCKVLADFLIRQSKPAAAMEWVERGLGLGRQEGSSVAGLYLQRMRLDLLERLGRAEQAREICWLSFENNPGKREYQNLMRFVPPAERDEWHAKAMAASEKGSLSDQIELWSEVGEIDRLVGRMERVTDSELVRLGDMRSQSLAAVLEKDQPDQAARVFCALALGIVDRAKAKAYPQAVRYFRRAKACFAAAGQQGEWEELVADVRRRHRRKKRFIPDFEDVVAGKDRPAPPTFIELARKHGRKV